MDCSKLPPTDDNFGRTGTLSKNSSRNEVYLEVRVGLEIGRQYNKLTVVHLATIQA